MAKKILRIPAPALTSGSMPELGVCALHGQRATTNRKRTFSTATPLWVIPLLLVSLLLGLIVALAVRKQAVGPMPECAICRAGRTRFRTIVWCAWGTTLAMLIATVATDSSAAVLAMFVALFLSVVLSIMGSAKQVKGTLSKDQLWLELRSTHPAFDQAVTARMTAAMAPPAHGYPAMAQPLTPPGSVPSGSGYFG